MRISISGETKLDLKGLFGPSTIQIKAILGDFHITEQAFQQDSDYSVRDAQETLTTLTIISQTSNSLVLKMLNADALKLRVRERIQVQDVDENVVGYIDLKTIENADSPDEATHKKVTFRFDGTSTTPTNDGTYLSETVIATHILVLFEDTVLEEGEESDKISTNQFKAVFVKGTGTIELSSLKKKD